MLAVFSGVGGTEGYLLRSPILHRYTRAHKKQRVFFVGTVPMSKTFVICRYWFNASLMNHEMYGAGLIDNLLWSEYTCTLHFSH